MNSSVQHSASVGKPKVVHIMSTFSKGGTEIGLLTLIKNGFYDGVDLSVVGVVRGDSEPIRQDFIDLLGKDRVHYFMNRETSATKRHLPLLTLKTHNMLRELKPDTIVLSYSHAAFIGRIAALARPSTKVITFEHSAVELRRTLAFGLTVTSRRNDVVFSDTKETMTAMGRYYSKPNIGHNVPLIIVPPAEARTAETPEQFSVLSLGRLSREKNYPELIKAAAILANEGRKFTLTIAGEGKERPHLESLTKELGVSDRVKMPGWASNAGSLHRAAHIYVQPSLHEGLCLATVEAMAAGVPTVATDFGGSREYGIDGKNMLKVKGYGASDIADSLRRMMDNYGALAAPLSQAGIATMQERFGESEVKQKWQMAANELVTPRSRTASSSQPALRPDAKSREPLFPTPRK